VSGQHFTSAVLPTTETRTAPKKKAGKAVMSILRTILLSGLLLVLPSLPCGAGTQPALPEAATMLREVEAHQKQLDTIRENYTFRAIQTTHQLDSHGNVKKVETEEHEVFFVNRHRVEKLTRKDGKDLSPDQARKEQDRVNKEVLKFSAPAESAPDKDEISVARLLQIVKFTRPRRVPLNGRDTVAFDFEGDEHAKTKGRQEDALKKVSGTIWIDEAAHEVARMNATLDENYRIGFGLLASVAKGSNVVFDQALIHNEAWLPTSISLHLQARALLVAGFRADIDIRFDQYRKFQTDAEQQPGATVTHPAR
jgi:cellobiose-specific phosphotransferase system component IIA